MKICCPNCSEVLESPVVPQEGQHLLCPFCNTKFLYSMQMNKEDAAAEYDQSFRSSDDSPIRISLPQECNCNEDSIPYSKYLQRDELPEDVKVNIIRRIGRWWGKQPVLSKCFIIGIVAFDCFISLNILYTVSTKRLTELAEKHADDLEEKNELTVWIDRLTELEKKYVTNSVEYVEAHIDLIRNFTLAMKKKCVEEHRAFIEAMDRAGYWVSHQQYSNYTFDSLLVVNKYTGAHGHMRKGLSGDWLIYPSWLPAEDARMIWDHFYHEAMNDCESSLEDTERQLSDMERRLRHLKSLKK